MYELILSPSRSASEGFCAFIYVIYAVVVDREKSALFWPQRAITRISQIVVRPKSIFMSFVLDSGTHLSMVVDVSVFQHPVSGKQMDRPVTNKV